MFTTLDFYYFGVNFNSYIRFDFKLLDQILSFILY